MEWAALIAWVVTAGGGFILLGIWLKNGGLAQQTQPGQRIRPPLLFSHFGLAALGLVAWIIYVATDSDVLAWISFVALLVIATLGFTMFAIWLRRRRAPAAAAAPATGMTVEPAEQRFPTAIVGLHGLLGATTLVLVFLTAVGVGD